MGERVLRGSRLGAVSYETEHAAEMAPRQLISYVCPQGHHFAVPFAEEAEVPGTWDCRFCPQTALLQGAAVPVGKKVKPTRTHWDMLLERRTVGELETLLGERLAVLRERTGTAARKSA